MSCHKTHHPHLLLQYGMGSVGCAHTLTPFLLRVEGNTPFSSSALRGGKLASTLPKMHSERSRSSSQDKSGQCQLHPCWLSSPPTSCQPLGSGIVLLLALKKPKKELFGWPFCFRSLVQCSFTCPEAGLCSNDPELLCFVSSRRGTKRRKVTKQPK